MAGVWNNYGAARDSAGWTWSEAQKAARDYWGATKSKTKQTWDQVGGENCLHGRMWSTRQHMCCQSK